MSLCSMPYEDWGQDPATLWDERRVRARKEHRCHECNGTISPGETYGRAKGLCDGSWSIFRRCPACLVLAEWAATVTGECALWGGLSESIENANNFLPIQTYDEELDEYVGGLPHPWDWRKAWEAAR